MAKEWEWHLTDIQAPSDNAPKVFSAFSCGGGSSMGYKLAGCNVLGNVEIDPAINKMYIANNHPKYNYCMDIRDFNKVTDLPKELYELDILDGSPPCSTFSMAGKREKGWGVEKRFREGQKLQTLDDLFFVFIDTVNKLRPKAVVAENVKGLLAGNAKGYVSLIIDGFKKIGYDMQIFLLNSARFGVPQSRERVFFIANRMGYPKLHLDAVSDPMPFSEVKSKDGTPFKINPKLRMLLDHKTNHDTCVSDINMRLFHNDSLFGYVLVRDSRICPTLTASGLFIRDDETLLSKQDIINVQSFPQDYDFLGNDPQYVCGMSVPPILMKHIAKNIREQWFNDANRSI